MSTTVTASKVIDAPVREVYNQWTQFEDFPHFMSAVEKVTQLDETHTRWDVEIGGAHRTFDATITEQIPDRKIRWESIDEPRQMGEVTFAPDGDGTRVELAMTWAPEGFVENVGAALNIDNMAVERDLSRFADFIADRQAATGSWRGRVGDAAQAPGEEAPRMPDGDADGVDPDLRV